MVAVVVVDGTRQVLKFSTTLPSNRFFGGAGSAEVVSLIGEGN